VCPNDAFFAIPTPEPAEPAEKLPGRQQYLLFAELCNECGNCMTFCPENGDPAVIKPRLFTDRSVFEGRTGQGFLLAEGAVTGRVGDEADARVVAALLGTAQGNPLGGTSS
jgi:putative selenate reductase